MLFCFNSTAEVKVVMDHNPNGEADASFKFSQVPSPSATDTGTKAKFTLVSGERDSNGADLEALHDGKLPVRDDQPEANFFFAAGTEGVAQDFAAELVV